MGTRKAGRLRAVDGRLHAWLRILIVVVLFVLATTVAAAVGNLAGPLAAQFTVAGVAVLLVTVVLFAVFARRLDRRRVHSYGLAMDGRWWLDLAVGAVIGLLVGGGIHLTVNLGMTRIFPVGIGVALVALWLWVRVRPGVVDVDEAIAVRSDDGWVTTS